VSAFGAGLVRELLYWLPSGLVLDLHGALLSREREVPVDLSFRTQRSGAYCLQGTVSAERDGALHGSGQLGYWGGEPELRLYLCDRDGEVHAWLGRWTAGAKAWLPAGAEFTGTFGDAGNTLSLRLDYRAVLVRLRAARRR
jgi:hypothetical protein